MLYTITVLFFDLKKSTYLVNTIVKSKQLFSISFGVILFEDLKTVLT